MPDNCVPYSMRNVWYVLPLLLLFSCDGGEEEKKESKPVIKGADVSFLPQFEASGIDYKDATGNVKNLLDILKESGVNTIRLRLWHTPQTDHASLTEVKALAERVHATGMNVWLTVHYSDTWADPGHQQKPEAWGEASFTDLQDSVYKYTKKIIREIGPEIIQIGNEINGGFLLPDGSTDNVPDFVALLKKGVQAVRETSPDTKIMIHIAGFDVAAWFYQQLDLYDVEYDLIGLSYYPVWHGKSFTTVQSVIDKLGLTYGKDVVIAETAYPFSLGWEDNVNNTVGLAGQLYPGYEATPAGQKAFLQKIREIVISSPRGAGFCYWGAEWMGYGGEIEIDGELKTGSTWENQALFDFSNKALPALDVFKD